MIATLDIVSLLLAGLLGMAVGGNNLSACCGPLIGSGMVNRRTGILLAITGYILGVSIALGTFNSSGYLALILAFWFLVPLAATALGVLLVGLDDRLSPRNLWLKLSLLKTGLLLVSFLSAYVLGSNTLGLIAGVIYNQTLYATIAVGLGAVLGTFVLGRS